MILKLINGDKVEVFRQNCGFTKIDIYKYPTGSTMWNIDPQQLIQDEESGFFVIAKWGSGYNRDSCGNLHYAPEHFDRMIPVGSVVEILKPGEWERPIILLPAQH